MTPYMLPNNLNSKSKVKEVGETSQDFGFKRCLVTCPIAKELIAYCEGVKLDDNLRGIRLISERNVANTKMVVAGTKGLLKSKALVSPCIFDGPCTLDLLQCAEILRRHA